MNDMLDENESIRRNKKQPIVYVVQNQHQLDREKMKYVSKYDLSSAEKFGKLVYILPPNQNPFATENLVADMWTVLENYSDDDFLLLIGNPILIGMTVAIAAMTNSGHVKMLMFSRRDDCYIPMDVEL